MLPEGALAAGAQKVLSAAGTLIKEEGALAKVATTFESAREHVASLSEKMATLNKKMEALLHKENNAIRAIEDSEGPRLKTGTIAHGLKPSQEFIDRVDAVPLSPGQKSFIAKYKVQFEKVHNMGAALGEDQVFSLGTYKHNMNIVRVAEKSGYLEDLFTNNDIAHTVHHELGHAMNDFLGQRNTRPFTPVSDREDFARQFIRDINQDTDAARTAKAQLEHRFGDDIQAQMHEAFASCIGHSYGPSNNPHANALQEAFKDGYYKLVDAFKKEHIEKEHKI